MKLKLCAPSVPLLGILVVLVYTSCATVPVEKDRLPAPTASDNAVFLMKLTSDSRATVSYFAKYYMEIEGVKEKYLVTPGRKYRIITELPPGEYRIKRFIVSVSRNFHGPNQFDVDFPFNLQSGVVTVLPVSMDFRHSPEGQSTGFHLLKAEEEELILEDLKATEEYQEWKVRFLKYGNN